MDVLLSFGWDGDPLVNEDGGGLLVVLAPGFVGVVFEPGVLVVTEDGPDLRGGTITG